ncbi:hypothetical protein RJ640_022277 [Escallonia rubra]|uniref:Uncharacterized protein n=1 Tax=Escallonia rubra TaxID=112253 RepID=A0AA88UKF4_9ASTE|nr:hypothetical protein RJ640_022277 [Escallonia rubra]
MEATAEAVAGLLEKIRPPRLEDAGLEDCVLPPESIKEAFLKAATAVKSTIFSPSEDDEEEPQGKCRDPTTRGSWRNRGNRCGQQRREEVLVSSAWMPSPPRQSAASAVASIGLPRWPMRSLRFVSKEKADGRVGAVAAGSFVLLVIVVERIWQATMRIIEARWRRDGDATASRGGGVSTARVSWWRCCDMLLSLSFFRMLRCLLLVPVALHNR